MSILKIFKRFSKRKLFFLFLVLVAVGIFIWFRFIKPKNGLQEARVERGDVAEELVLSGEVSAKERADLSFETSGQIAYVGAKEGDIVKKAQVLAKLDTTTLNSAYQEALSNLRAAEATVENVHDQVKDHSGDETYAQKDTRTTAEVAKDNAYEAVKIAEKNLKGATLAAPFPGIVTYVANPFAGVFVVYSQKQFELFNPETIYFRVAADQSDVTKLKVGQGVSIILDSFPEKEVTGSITEISYAPDPNEVGVVYEIKTSLDKSDIEYRLGMTGDAKFILQEVKDTLFVPSKFIKSDKDGQYLLVDKGKNKRYIEVGVEGETTTEVKGDVTEGELIYD